MASVKQEHFRNWRRQPVRGSKASNAFLQSKSEEATSAIHYATLENKEQARPSHHRFCHQIRRF